MTDPTEPHSLRAVMEQLAGDVAVVGRLDDEDAGGLGHQASPRVRRQSIRSAMVPIFSPCRWA